jgi:hypothetical protein
MIRKRAAYDPLQTSAQPRWLTVRTFGGGLLEARRLDPGTDLVRTLLSAMLEFRDSGWELGEFGSASGAVRLARGAEKRMLSIETRDPEGDGRHATWSGQCIGCED